MTRVVGGRSVMSWKVKRIVSGKIPNMARAERNEYYENEDINTCAHSGSLSAGVLL